MIVGIGYKKRRGKDTVAAFLREDHGFRCLAYADSLKEAARQIAGFTQDQLYGDQKEVVDPFWGFSPRWLNQRLGTEVVRAIRPDMWVRSLERKLEKIPSHIPVVVTDVRYWNEAEMVRNRGGVVVRVDRPQLDDEERPEKVGPFKRFALWIERTAKRKLPRELLDAHSSENALDDYKFDVVLLNDGTLEELRVKVEALVQELKSARE